MHSTGKTGHLIDGPYERFEPGRYRLVLKGSAKNWTEKEALGIVCNHHGQHRMEEFKLTWRMPGEYQEEHEFSLNIACENIGIRVFVSEQSALSVETLSFENI